MKTSWKTKALVLSMLLAGGPVYAQGDLGLLEDTESVLESPDIDIDGSFRKKESKADRIAKMRKKLENQSQDMVDQKIENIRIKQEKELAGKLKNAFQGNLERTDKVNVSQAATQKVEKVAPAPEVKDKRGDNKVTPRFGVTNFVSDDVDFESQMDIGVELVI